MEPKRVVFAGRLSVTDDAFVLVATDIRIAPGVHVAFAFKGEDDGGPFTCSGSAIFNPTANFYVAAQVPIVCTRGGHADIRFARAQALDGYCDIEGTWSQDGYLESPWTFWGELDALES